MVSDLHNLLHSLQHILLRAVGQRNVSRPDVAAVFLASHTDPELVTVEGLHPLLVSLQFLSCSDQE
jgi:hypothetical protein